MSIADRTDLEAFGRRFLETYLQGGFGTLPKREIDLLVLRLLLDCRTGERADGEPSQIDAFEWARDLRTTRTRVRSMLDELSFRQPLSAADTKEKLKSILIRQTPRGDASEVRIQIEDAFLRAYARRIVQEDLGVVDTSFDRTIINLEGPKYLSLVAAVADEQAFNELQRTLIASKPRSVPIGDKGLFRTFLQKMIEGAGAETGRLAVKLGAGLLLGPAPILDSAQEWFSQVWSRPTADHGVGQSNDAAAE